MGAQPSVPADIAQAVGDIIKDYNAANPTAPGVVKPRVGPGLYTGRWPAIKDDQTKFTYYESQSKDIKLSGWIGDELLYANSTSAQALDTWTNLGEINVKGKLVKLEASYSTAEDAVRELKVTYKDNATETVCNNPRGAPALQPATPPALDLTNDKIVKVEIKARKQEGKDTTRICGIKVTTAANKVWKVNKDFDTITAEQSVVELPPIDGWDLRGFYGAYASSNVIRMGCVWGYKL